jgi:8-oxo-dGTP pyrophosphatase MutT (NUDIX family)
VRPAPLHAAAVATLSAWRPPDTAQAALRTTYLAHLAAHPDGMWRSCVPDHLTASALVLDAAADRVLLTLHKKGGFWGQLGGHCEASDSTLAGAALREATEESGIPGLRVVGGVPVDLDQHVLSPAFGACGSHLDVRYAVVAPPGAEPVVSDESHDLAWFAVDALPPEAVGDLRRLVDRARAALLAGPGRPPAQSSDRSNPAVAETPSR